MTPYESETPIRDSAGVDDPTCEDLRHDGCLPQQPVRLIDREREAAAIEARLLRPEVRLLTVSGPGGVGKTALAIAVARAVEHHFADGAAFVDLEPLRSPRGLLSAIAEALGMPVRAEGGVELALRTTLRLRELLLVLDNVEHVMEAAPAVSALLASCPSITVLTTSREPLGVRWEHEFPLAPLRLPCDATPMTAAVLAEVPSVALFLERVQAIRPDFTLTDDNAPIIAGICRRLDGLPLAIEMAAARMRTVSAALLLWHIEQRSDLLGARVPDAPPRHQTLGDVIGWSYDLLSEPEQRLLRRMAVFERGCTREAAEALTDGDPCELALLVEKSLATPVDGVAGESRIRLLETVRSFALERLREAGEEASARQLHAEYLLRFSESIASRVRQHDDASHWRGRLNGEEDNVRSALRWLLDSGEVALATRLQAAVTEVDLAQREPAGETTPADAPQRLLTRREREVAQLIAQGLTSRKIAEALHISEKTVDCHADHIRTKLDLGSRAEIAAWAVAHRLHDPGR